MSVHIYIYACMWLREKYFEHDMTVLFYQSWFLIHPVVSEHIKPTALLVRNTHKSKEATLVHQVLLYAKKTWYLRTCAYTINSGEVIGLHISLRAGNLSDNNLADFTLMILVNRIISCRIACYTVAVV